MTLFDSYYLPMGLSLYNSLIEQAQPFHLWVICMDEIVEDRLRLLSLLHLTLIKLKDVENNDLIKVKSKRSKGEYCWTMTPFAPQFVLEINNTIDYITYIDVDMFFFNDPRILLNEFYKSGKHVLITEHFYAPEYNQASTSGRFCVQFMTFRRTPESKKIMNWWQERCLEWCSANFDKGRLGDQKYLDDWPTMFESDVHILKQVEKTLAPWNVFFFEKKFQGKLDPVFYHFEGFRIVNSNKAFLYSSYKIGEAGLILYDRYISNLRNSINILKNRGFPIQKMTRKKENYQIPRDFIRRLTGRIHYKKI